MTSEVTVRSVVGAAFTQEIEAGGHRMTADEPAEFGGDDRGPGPYEYLLAALGSCTSMTLHMYARKKDWDLREVEVVVTHRRVHAKDCDDCEDGKGMEALERVIRLEGPLSPEQRSRLLEIADRCPVHRTLQGDLRIVTRAS